MNLKLFKPDYHYNRQHNLDYSLFSGYMKTYKNKQVFFGGLTSTHSTSPHKSFNERANKHEKAFQLSLIIKRYNNFVSKKPIDLHHRYLALTIRKKSKPKAIDMSKSNGSLLLTQMPKVSSNHSLESFELIKHVMTSKAINEKEKSWSMCMSINSSRSLGNMKNRIRQVNGDKSVKQLKELPQTISHCYRNKSQQFAKVARAYTTKSKVEALSKYDAASFLNEDEGYSDPTLITKELRKRCGFFKGNSYCFNEAKWRVFKAKSNLRCKLLPKHSVHHLHIMNKKREKKDF